MRIEIITQRHRLSGVYNFLNKHAREAMACLPPPMLDIFAVAFDKRGDIVSCCGASMAREGKLHLEKIYQIDSRTERFLAENQEALSEIGRWFSIMPDAAPQTLRAVVEYLREQNVHFALCEMKPQNMRRARMLGLKFESTESQLDFAALDPTEKKYYVGHNPPQLYTLDLRTIDWH